MAPVNRVTSHLLYRLCCTTLFLVSTPWLFVFVPPSGNLSLFFALHSSVQKTSLGNSSPIHQTRARVPLTNSYNTLYFFPALSTYHVFENNLSCWNINFGTVVILFAFSPRLLSTEQTVSRSTDASYIACWMSERWNDLIQSSCS